MISLKSAKLVFVFREKVKVNEQVDETGNCSASVNSIVGLLNPRGGTDSHEVKKVIISFNDADPCSPRAIQ